MPHYLTGKHYNPVTKQYDPDVVSETVESFSVSEPPTRIDWSKLPSSPKGIAAKAMKMGWDVRCWRSVGFQEPTLYMTASEDAGYSAGDVRFEGYRATIYTVEAQDGGAIGFQAHFMGKEFDSGKKGSNGSFDSARVLDPAGIPHELFYEYEPIPVTRGKDETTKSHKAREDASQQMALDLNLTMNDGAMFFSNTHIYTAARELEAWLAEWSQFYV